MTAKLNRQKKDSVLSRDSYSCRLCGKPWRMAERELEIHHVIPKSQGGSNRMENLVTVCKPCHRQQHQ